MPNLFGAITLADIVLMNSMGKWGKVGKCMVALIPDFGIPANLNPTGTGDCDGVTNPAGTVVKIPCFCPPDRGEFIQVRVYQQREVEV